MVSNESVMAYINESSHGGMKYNMCKRNEANGKRKQ